MAVHKGREVQLLGRIPGVEEFPLYRVIDKDNNVEHVALNNMQFTADEKKQLQRDYGLMADSLNVIEEKDLKELRDGQDSKKIQERQKAEQKEERVLTEQVKPLKIKTK